MKRFVVIALAVLVTVGAFGQATVRYVMPGDASPDNDTVIAAVNARLGPDAGLKLETVYVPWDAWENKINLMLASGDEFDLVHVMQDWIPYTSYFSKGGLADITDSIAKYGANLVKNIPAAMWPGAKVKGRTYVIPTFWAELATEGDFTIRTDFLKQNGLSLPRTPAEMLTAMETVAKNWKGSDKPYLPLAPSVNNADPIGMHSSVLHRAYASFPFTVKEKLFYVSQSGQARSWVETPEFKQDAAWFRSAYVKGLISPDVLTIKQDQVVNQINSGNWLVSWGTIGSYKDLQKNWPALQDADILTAMFNPEKPDVRPWGIKNCNAVPSTTTNPDLGVKFMNWLYASQSNYDLFLYGVEGKHYTTLRAHQKDSVMDPTGRPLYIQADWMMGNLNFIRLDSVIPAATIKDIYTIDSKAINSPAADLFFDSSNVRAELANVMSQFSAVMLPVYMGVVDWDKNYPAALDKMKKAGLDRLVAEYQKQLAAFLAAHK
ncbi:MAG TPA: extracellular solute-binding protein [Spirochaetia bacterium]|nr:extracellular solute-binding protein [Spirochaetia bacterium]